MYNEYYRLEFIHFRVYFEAKYDLPASDANIVNR
jgi:hypothetical protein